MKFKLKKFALIAEILGGFAIVTSLVFVGIQFKENAIATKSANASATVAAMADWYVTMGNNSESSALFYNFMADPDALTPQGRFQAVMNAHGLFIIFQNSFYLVKEGTLDAEMQNSLTSAMLGAVGQPGFKFFWDQRKSYFFNDFRLYIEDLIKNGVPVKSIYKDIPPKNNQ